jgi:predicted nucleotidyltransferase
MDMSDDYVAGWRRRLIADKVRRNMRAQEAASAAQKCAQVLYENYGARKVYLFGSLNEPERFHDKSDIDLVVDGLPPRLYFKALAELWRLLPPGMQLDLIPFEDAASELRERVVKEGVTLSG